MLVMERQCLILFSETFKCTGALHVSPDSWRDWSFHVRLYPIRVSHYHLHAPSDMSPQQEVFNNAIELFASDQEDVRTAAAFAAGQSLLVVVFYKTLPCIIRR
jgi:hypothetical protein